MDSFEERRECAKKQFKEAIDELNDAVELFNSAISKTDKVNTEEEAKAFDDWFWEETEKFKYLEFNFE